MNWSNIKLVWHRELRDQLRDRRSLFMVAVLPVLLYPMLGALGFQLVGFLQKHSTQVLIIGSEQLDSIEPPLFRGDQFANTLWPPGSPPPNFALSLSPSVGENNNQLRQAREALARGEWDVVVYFPPGFADQIADLQRPTSPPVGTPSSPRPAVFYNSAKEASEVGFHRFNSLLDVWQAQLVRGNLAARDVPESVTMPFQVETSDVASADGKQIRTWSRLLPFVVFVWALTGAFYPAVDLCAGEKERGTLESLLTSPALRSEIVSGKLLTVITFSIASALANLGSMVLTGKVVLDQMAAMAPGGDIGLEPPPFSAVVWLLVALLPMSALFSALSLAVAAFARSTKEGQYYLMPLLLGSMPLMMLPLAPNIELNFGTSIVPITGVVLLLRSAIEGNIAAALPFLPNVALVTAGCCILAIRWAVAQFNSETVLFRESENFTPWLWLRKLYTNRPAIHGGGAAVACIVAILFLQFMARGALTTYAQSLGVEALILLSQLCILLPPVVMAFTLARRPFAALGLTAGMSLWRPAAAVLVAALLHPAIMYLLTWITWVFPVSSDLEELAGVLQSIPLWHRLALLALLPAVVEELAFRGFILNGLRQASSNWSAVVVSAFAFGISHGILQQSLAASLVGLLLGWIAIRTGGIFTGIAYHVTHNALVQLRSDFGPAFEAWLDDNGLETAVLGSATGPERLFTPVFTLVCASIAAVLVWGMCRRHSAAQNPELQ